MRREWNPIDSAGKTDLAEMMRPRLRHDASVWTTEVDSLSVGDWKVVREVMATSPGWCRFEIMASKLKDDRLPWPANVTILAGLITTQAEAHATLPDLFRVRASKLEAVFMPSEAIHLRRYLESPRLDAVRVRGGDRPMPLEYVRNLAEQALVAKVPFSLTWGDWVPLGQLPPGVPFGHCDVRCPFGRVAGVYVKIDRERPCHQLDGANYPES